MAERLGADLQITAIPDVLKGLSDLHAAKQAVVKGEGVVKNQQREGKRLEAPITFVVKPAQGEEPLVAEFVVIYPDKDNDEKVLDRRHITRDAPFEAQDFALVGPDQDRGIVFGAERTEGSLEHLDGTDLDLWDEYPRAWHLYLDNHQLANVEVEQVQAGQPSIKWVAGEVVRKAVDPLA